MLRGNSTQFLWRYENNMYGGNAQWADPEEARRVGQTVGEELIGRFEHLDDTSDDDSPEVRKSAHKVLDAALEVIDYAALPTERRVNILRGVIDALAENGVLGGESEYARLESQETAPSAVAK